MSHNWTNRIEAEKAGVQVSVSMPQPATTTATAETARRQLMARDESTRSEGSRVWAGMMQILLRRCFELVEERGSEER